MPRKPRVEYAGAIYHVISRGDRQNLIYRDEKDKKSFLHTLEESCQRCGWRIHAYVLMNNHYHLLLETPEPNLVIGMKWLQGTYTQRFNGRYKEWGHLFQGRYKALLVDGDSGNYFSTVATYIHLNPIRAGLLHDQGSELEDFHWSSYPAYLEPNIRPEWLSVERVLGALGYVDDTAGKQRFNEYMNGRVLEVETEKDPVMMNKKLDELRRSWCYGSSEFRGRMETLVSERIKAYDRRSYSGREVEGHDESMAQTILERGLKIIKISEDELPLLAKGDCRKKVIAWAIRQRTCVRNEWIAEKLHMGSYSNMSRHVNSISLAVDDEVVRFREMMKYEV